MKRKRLLVGVQWLLIVLVAVWLYGRLEVYCFFWPSIDTKFAPGFSEKEFSRISNGMSTVEVESKLGTPIVVFTNSAGLEEWLFTDDGKCWWGDFAWLWRSVAFSNGSVVSVDHSIRYD